jgi:alpha-1,2-mannosyltransferase
MYAMSLASGLFLLDKLAASVAVSAIGVILGWPFSILAFLPVTLYSLYKKFKQAFIAGAVTSVILLVSPIISCVDLHWPSKYAYTIECCI